MLRRTTNVAAVARRVPSTSRCLSSTPKRQSDITLEVDGVSVTVPQGTALIQACEKAGTLQIPRLQIIDVGEHEQLFNSSRLEANFSSTNTLSVERRGMSMELQSQ